MCDCARLGLPISSPMGQTDPEGREKWAALLHSPLPFLWALGLLSISLAQAQDAYGGVASDTGGEVSIRAPKRPVVKRYAAAIRENFRRLRHPYSRRIAGTP